MSYNNQQETTPAKKHKCQFHAYTSDKPFNVRRHIGRKHSEMNNTNVQSYASPMEIENAGVVYRQNYRQLQAPPSYPQLPLHGAATVNQFNIPPPQQPVNQPVYHQPVYYQQPLINGSEPQDHTQLVHHQGAYLGGCDQGGYLSDVGTQTSSSSDDEEPDILELLKDTEQNFMDLKYIK